MSQAKTQLSFYGLVPDALNGFLLKNQVSLQHRPAMTRQVYKSQGHAWEFDQCPKRLRPLLEKLDYTVPKIKQTLVSSVDSSTKFLLQLGDKSEIEMVLMPERNRLTLCLSSQVGCAQGCVFCNTSRMGLKRNLRANEIVGQVMVANRWLAANVNRLTEVTGEHLNRVTNIVFMGMGEPLDNLEGLLPALEILTSKQCLAFGPRKICVSTAGHLPGLIELSKRFPKISLSFSLHFLDSKSRSKMMPINKKWPLDEIAKFLKDASASRRVMIQHTLIADKNDSLEEASKLAEMFAGYPIKVNLIPFNSFKESILKKPEIEKTIAFRNHLLQRGLRTMIRYSKGPDIAAACGQLVVNRKEAFKN